MTQGGLINGYNTQLSFETRSFGELMVVTSAYRLNESLAVELIDEDEQSFTFLSVNLPEVASLLGKGEFFAKTWNENAEVAEDALASGIFTDTGRTSGDMLNAPIWKFN